MKPLVRCLDLFCCAGGAGMGYHRAGFDVTGVDINSQPRYPFRFIQGDAMEFVEKHGKEFDFIHASPPCQGYSVTRFANKGKTYPMLLPRTRDLLVKTGRPWVIENVVGAPMNWHVTLCGVMFGLKTYRHRRFELSFLVMQPEHPKHPERLQRKGRNPSVGGYSNPCGHANVSGEFDLWKISMGIDWMNAKEITQAVPPAYTEWIGKKAMEWITANAGIERPMKPQKED